jgi:hypothetical protein
MSHTTKLKAVEIRDVAALHAAVGDLKASGVNCDLVQNQKPRMYYGDQHGTCAYVLKLHSAPYDVGFDLQADGSYAPVFDEWQGYVGSQIGAACPMPNTQEGRAQHAIGKFTQSYAKHAAINAAMAQGYMVEGTEVDQDGNVHLTLAVM